MTYVADFYDRRTLDPPVAGPDGDSYDSELRCRPCGYVFGHIPRDWLDAHVGETVPCPSCALGSRIPTVEEAEWPNRKAPDDPVAGIPVTERRRA